jgi:Uma2 family endonuclease
MCAAQGFAAVAIAALTAEEIAQYPKEKRGELIRGVWRPRNPRVILHGMLVATIGAEVHRWVESHKLGAATTGAGYILERDPDTVLGPDVAFVRADRLPPPERWWGYFEGAPDLAVEVIAPLYARAYVEEKVAMYLGAGTHVVWIVDTERRSMMICTRDGEPRTLSEGDVLDGGDVLPGFTLPVAEIFS